jgi:S-adenosylmethionine:tRNA ribosyltransferase-isomerase
VEIARLLLHVGLGTFRPVVVEDIREHHMHTEHYEISTATARQLNQTRQNGKRVVAVGTTVVRTLETIYQQGYQAGQGETDKFIYPGYRFQAVDALLTNFHLPGSSLLMLVAALAGNELIRYAYQHAIRERYRFFSYGDAMLII